MSKFYLNFDGSVGLSSIHRPTLVFLLSFTTFAYRNLFSRDCSCSAPPLCCQRSHGVVRGTRRLQTGQWQGLLLQLQFRLRSWSFKLCLSTWRKWVPNGCCQYFSLLQTWSRFVATLASPRFGYRISERQPSGFDTSPIFSG